ncbi:innexin domain-containing protein [Ditylenchus destructor]|nr:innexin domain-containing protein [Ditylenchus destructor]
MSAQFGAISSVNTLIGKVFTQPKGDLAARLNCRYTVTILAVSAGLLLTTHFWGEPITCWLPAEFTKGWTDYANQYCYVHGTYFSFLEQPLDWNEGQRQKIAIDYYQWVPYVLALQAIFFYIPRFLWKVLSSFSGYDLPGSIRHVDLVWNQVRMSTFAERMQVLDRQLTPYLWDGIRLSKRRNRGQLSLHYLLYTLIQASNATLMFLWLNQLINSPMYSWSGSSILVDLYNGRNWQSTGHFPRITHCDFARRKLASTSTETITCVLTLNFYYEKLLLFLWFWMLFVTAVSWLNCITWARVMCLPQASKVKLQSFLAVHAGTSVYGERFFRALGPDGTFILHQISLNIGDLPTSYVTLSMYNAVEQSENGDHGDHSLTPLLEKGSKAV